MSERDEARALVGAWYEKTGFCGCGRPELILREVLDALRQHGEPGGNFKGGPDIAWQDGHRMVMYCLDVWDLTEHGGGIGGAWLTDEGVRLRDALAAVDIDTVLDDEP